MEYRFDKGAVHVIDDEGETLAVAPVKDRDAAMAEIKRIWAEGLPEPPKGKPKGKGK
jgi:hypothetical protein